MKREIFAGWGMIIQGGCGREVRFVENAGVRWFCWVYCDTNLQYICGIRMIPVGKILLTHSRIGAKMLVWINCVSHDYFRKNVKS